MSTTERKLRHIGFIVDGNRRWAKRRNLPTLEGHRRGFDKVEKVIENLQDTEVEFISFYLFSTENWDRSPEEVAYLMKLAKERIESLTKKCQKENLRLVIMGRSEQVDPKLWQKMQDAENSTAQNTSMTICICFNYGGLWEIADAANKVVTGLLEQDEHQTTPSHITNMTPETFRRYLYHPEVPDCDLIVRTGGEQRLSGFQLWRAAYAEFLFVPEMFPDLEPEHCQDFIAEYYQRHRRFGE